MAVVPAIFLVNQAIPRSWPTRAGLAGQFEVYCLVRTVEVSRQLALESASQGGLRDAVAKLVSDPDPAFAS
jgi:hypothetical protein